jgi:hypothetical protein
MRKILTLLLVFISLSAFGQLDTINLSISYFGLPSIEGSADFMRDEGYKSNQAMRSIDSLNNVIDVTDSSGVFTTITTDVLIYDPPHGAMNFSDSATVIALTQNVWAKITGPSGDLFMIRDADDLTIAGDSITIEIDGDYMLWTAFSFDGTTNSVFHIAVYKNGVVTDWEMHRKTATNDTGNMSMPTYIENLVVGDDISIWIENTGNSNDATMISGQVVITMLHPD